MAAVSPVGRAAGLEPLELAADSRAAAALFERHSKRVFAYCLSRLGRREDAEDAAQTTFLHAVRGLRGGVIPSIEVAWLLGIARNVCLSRRESVGRRGRLELACDPADLERNAAPQGRGDELIGLEAALARLPERQRQAVLLRDWRGLSYEEVAAQMHVSLANVETLIFRGRRTLAEHLQEQPSATRRRLASLGNAGSLFTWAKTAFTGAAAIAKVAVAVTVVVAAGTGIAAGTSVLDRGTDVPGRKPTVAATSTRPAPAPPAAATVPRVDRIVVPPRAPATGDGSAATPMADAPAAPAAVAPDTTPAPAATVPRVEDAVSATSAPIKPTVAEVLPDLPVVSAPPLPDLAGSLPAPQLPAATAPIVEALPPVTVAVPPGVPLAPVTVELPTLLP